MKSRSLKIFLTFSIPAIALFQTAAPAMTLGIPAAGHEYIRVGDEWHFFRGKTPPSDPAGAWKEMDFDDAEWETGVSGFGYGDDDDATLLEDMEGSYVSVYIRKEFFVSDASGGVLQLVTDYDDGFIAYLNGDFVASRHMPDEPIDFETLASSHDAGSPETINLGKTSDLLRPGRNVLAIEGHNTSVTSTDFSLIPALRTTTDIVRDAGVWIVGTETVLLTGATSIPQAASVTINGLDAEFNPADGSWQGEIPLSAGLNHVTVEALDADTTVVDSVSAEILYIPPSRRLGGELAAETVWSRDPSPYVVEETVVIPSGAVLRIEPGTTVMLKDAASLVVFGQLLAEGTEQDPICFTHYGDGSTWGNIVFDAAEPSRLVHSVVEFSSSAGSYNGNDYLAAVAVVGTHLDVEACTFQKLPEESATAEGDGIDLSNGASAHISNSRFLSIGEGVHTDQCYILVENCLFTDMRGDNDGVDMDGESDPAPVVRNNFFIGSHDDALHPDRTSAIITGNVVTGCGDHGIVLRNPCTPYLANNIIYDCRSAGIAIENQCQALLVNNTIVDCGRGLRLFHLERPGSAPGGGHGIVRNCIIWNCPQPITLADESTVVVSYSNVNGTDVWPGEANINADPLFVDEENGDFHLTKSSPCIDLGDQQDAPDDDFEGYPRPRGTGFDMGSFESPYWPFLDTDEDGMADEWEEFFFGSLSPEPGDDFEPDGISNLAEYDLGTDPRSLDTDADGLPDGWELSYGLNPLFSTGDDGAQGDPDRDGFTNVQEATADTDPTDSASLFEIAELIRTEEGLKLKWLARAGREYRVLVSLGNEAWTEVATIPPGTDRLAEWLDPTANDHPRRFYKLQAIFGFLPPP